jgi:hypothetical protein
MNGEIHKKNKRRIGIRIVSVCVFLFFISLPLATSISASQMELVSILQDRQKTIEYTFLFSSPQLQERTLFDRSFTKLDMTGCYPIGKNAGEPTLPVKAIQLLLPAKTTVASITVTGEPVVMDTTLSNLQKKPLVPYQPPLPLDGTPPPSEIAFDESLYSSSASYPSAPYDQHYTLGYCRGYTILSLTLTPLQYAPSQGKLSYYPSLSVSVSLKEADHINSFTSTQADDEAWVKALVYNPEMTETYSGSSSPAPLLYPGGLCDPSQDYDYVIITTTQNSLSYWATSPSTPYNWESLMQKHQEKDGLSCTLVTIQDINACTAYQNADPLFNDPQAHIREFCKDAYQDWGTRYILIGGDADTIAARLMNYEYESNVDADIYWSNLDNTFNADHDSAWGEAGDTGFDLYSEMFIGRLTCDTPQDVSNWMKKSFYYADSNEISYLGNAAFYGGDTTWDCQGDDFEDYSAIKGTNNWLGPSPGANGIFPSWAGFQYGFETWNKTSQGVPYDLSVKWTAEPPNPGGWQGGSTSAAINGLKNAINNNKVTLLSGIAHANEQMSLDVTASAWESQYTNTKPFFIHDYGCHCGDFNAADDGVIESMLFRSDTKLSFACIYNTGYGWGQFDDTNSSSAYQQKAFWDYFFDLENHSGTPGNWQIGKGQAWSKDTMAPTINWDAGTGTWRGVIECCLLFGDPAQLIKPPRLNKAPETPRSPQGPANGVVGLPYTFTTNTTDPDGDSLLYQFDWGDGTTSEWVGPFASGATGNATHIWTAGGTYEIRVQAKDTLEALTPWSGPSSTLMDAPALQIQNVKGPVGLQVEFTDNGQGNATNVQWMVTILGGVNDLTLQKSGTISSIPAGESTLIQPFKYFFGLGKITIRVEATCLYGNTLKQEFSAFLLGIFVMNIK